MYLFTFSLLAFFAYIDIFLKKKSLLFSLLIIAILWLIFHDGFRWGIATDWNIYHDYFANCLASDNPDKFESGYVFLSKLIRNITDNYSVFLVFHAIIVYALISRSIIKYSINPLFSIFFFYCLMLTYLGMNRQYVSFAICIFSYKYIFDRKWLYFLMSILVASLFHLSAIMFLFAYFLNKQFSNKYLIALLIIVVMISLAGIMNRLPLGLFFLFSESIGDKVSFYQDSNFLTVNILISFFALLKRCIWIIIAMIYKEKFKEKSLFFTFFFNMYFVGTLIYILFNNTILQVVVARGILYYNVAEIFIIPFALSIFKDDITKKIAFALVAMYGFLMIEKGFNFYKEDLGYDIYRPYNSVLIDDKYNAYK